MEPTEDLLCDMKAHLREGFCTAPRQVSWSYTLPRPAKREEETSRDTSTDLTTGYAMNDLRQVSHKKLYPSISLWYIVS